MSKLTLYSQGTPNGITPPILLEELKDIYGGPDYEFVVMSIRDADIGKVHNQVKSEWYLKINPNGRIPAITDNGFNVFETSAVLFYLAQKYDKDHKLSYDPVQEPELYSEDLQWTFWTHGGIGPMQGQYNHFAKYAPEKLPYAINRYTNETKRLYGVLNTRLEGRHYLVGLEKGRFGLADIKTYGWAKFAEDGTIKVAEEFPNVKAWIDRIAGRPAVKRGQVIPK